MSKVIKLDVVRSQNKFITNLIFSNGSKGPMYPKGTLMSKVPKIPEGPRYLKGS